MRSDHLAVLTTLEDEAKEVVTVATGDHLLAKVNNWQCHAVVLDGHAFVSLIGLGYHGGGRSLVGGNGGGQGGKGQQEITFFHLNIPLR